MGFLYEEPKTCIWHWLGLVAIAILILLFVIFGAILLRKLYKNLCAKKKKAYHQSQYSVNGAVSVSLSSYAPDVSYAPGAFLSEQQPVYDSAYENYETNEYEHPTANNNNNNYATQGVNYPRGHSWNKRNITSNYYGGAYGLPNGTAIGLPNGQAVGLPWNASVIARR